MTERQATLQEIALYRAPEPRDCNFLCGNRTMVHTGTGVFVCIDCLSKLCVHDLGTAPAERDLETSEQLERAVEEVNDRDPWKHRSRKMRCHTCMYFVPKEGPDARPAGSLLAGRCRRHSPTMSGYPVVFETDWCGDHKLDEEKT